MKTRSKINIILVFVALAFSSCLKKDLPELPLHDTNLITTVNIEHRFQSPTNSMWDQPVVSYVKLNTTQVIDQTTSTITVTPVVPGTSNDFTAAERAKVTVTNLWPYYNISTAASMKGINGTPNPGNVTDCNKPLTYEVTAANGAKRVWTIKVNPLP